MHAQNNLYTSFNKYSHLELYEQHKARDTYIDRAAASQAENKGEMNHDETLERQIF